jgi:hypothetical protein
VHGFFCSTLHAFDPARAIDRERREQGEARVEARKKARVVIERPVGVDVVRPLRRFSFAQALSCDCDASAADAGPDEFVP